MRSTKPGRPSQHPSLLAWLQPHTGLFEEAEPKAPGLELDQVLGREVNAARS